MSSGASRFAILLGTAFLALSGCGDGRPSLNRGTATVKFNGEPLADAAVIFEPVVDQKKSSYARPSTAQTDAQGKFQLSTYADKDGAPAGKYRVMIIKQKRTVPPGMNPESPSAAELALIVTENLIPEKYSKPETSGLTAEITSSGIKPDVFELTP